LLADKLPSVLPILSEVGLVNPNNPEEVRKVKMVIRALGDRLKRFSDIIPYGGFFFKKDIEYDLAAVDKRLNKPGVDQILADLRNILDIPSELYSDYYLHELVEKYATQRSIGMGLIVNALRVAVTGQAVGPGLYDCLVIIGKDKVLERIQHAITLTTTG
jgi:glutamyl-tRNA synthetase